MYNFALIGLAGYVAPKHLKAIKETSNRLVVALDRTDSVGRVDQYFPQADFFIEPERFDRHVYKRQHCPDMEPVHYFSICSPNYLHDAHIRMALRNNAHAICEKPLVLSPWNLCALQQVEQETGKKIFNILQLRHHPNIIALKNKIAAYSSNQMYDVDLTYIAPRGKWYLYSWKGDEEKSGGLAANIGIHFFDMLQYIFGQVQDNTVHYRCRTWMAGRLTLQRAHVRWFLSIDGAQLPRSVQEKGQTVYRSIRVNGEEMDFTEGFTDLHTESYRNILSGNGFGLSEAATGVEMVHHIRHAELSQAVGKDVHPFVDRNHLR
jgi:UDP-N-acetyl-2-amino-2-deoxyglucuronate dehydrogenase